MKKTAALAALSALLLSAYSCAPAIDHDGQRQSVHSAFDYSYAPDRVAGATYYCAGDVPEVKDRIHVMVQGREHIALRPGRWREGAWDAAHVCDPSVTRGDFAYNGTPYDWAMLYTGTTDPFGNGTHNSVGLAFSNDQINWVKRPEPLMPNRCKRSDRTCWGVGQPWIMNRHSGSTFSSEVLMGVTGAGPGGHLVRHLDFGNVTDGPVEQIARFAPPTAGLNPVDHAQQLANADFAYEPGRDRMWVARASHFSRDVVPSSIAEQIEVAWMPAADFYSGRGTWRSLGGIDWWATNHRNNHNAGFAGNKRGHLTNPTFSVLVTTADKQSWPQALMDYRIHEVRIPS